ncbi:MAG: N5-carboxyaminoimidazole ribonucleotide synthase [Chroococcopsis gigantea SAG 12.99]|jgi:5-(carboxyamino)imidazole ribonucleotide synthase|nr:N5-carboxyaminoimidazole ribonucleotide synthase [Chroococcopsis gigantea SAG 12.99]
MWKRVGVIGGGQLAQMMAIEANGLGIELIVQTPRADDPAALLATEIVLGEHDDPRVTAELAQLCDVITFENEFVNLDALSPLAKQGFVFSPSLNCLGLLLDKYDQRSMLRALGLPVPEFSLYDRSQLTSFPLVIKARRHGYDGQGTYIVKDITGLSDLPPLSSVSHLVEEYVQYDRELAVIAARNGAGEIVIYPVVETHQKDQVCHWVIAPASLKPDIEAQIHEIARQILTSLEVIGVFGIEFFLTVEGRVLVNEIAPRTHNSGHYTLDACATSQFALQLQAVTDLPLGSPALKCPGAVMVNLLGYESKTDDYLKARERLKAVPHAHVHWYGKNQARPGRKLGHVTVLTDTNDRAELVNIAQHLENIWYVP